MKNLYINRIGNRDVLDRDQKNNVIKILLEAQNSNFKKTATHHHYQIPYEVLKTSSETHVVYKRKERYDSYVYVYCIEEYYDKLMIAHVETGHGVRDRMHQFCKTRGWVIARDACTLFASSCSLYNRKRNQVRCGVVVEQIISDGLQHARSN